MNNLETLRATSLRGMGTGRMQYAPTGEQKTEN